MIFHNPCIVNKKDELACFLAKKVGMEDVSVAMTLTFLLTLLQHKLQQQLQANPNTLSRACMGKKPRSININQVFCLDIC